MPYSIIFFGTSDFSLPSLYALINDARFDVKAIVTKPDMKVGRYQEIIKPPVKIMAEKYKIPVLQFESIKSAESYEALKLVQNDTQIDVYVVVSYGKIIPQKILNMPKYGTVNAHGSLLPKYRGASCVQSAIVNGDDTTGVTIMLIDAEMDHGPILFQKSTVIRNYDTGASLHDRLADMAGALLPEVLTNYIERKITPKEQEHESATYCKMLKREDGEINWLKSTEEIERMVRAYNPWPGTYTIKNGKRIKIFKAQKSNHELLVSNHDMMDKRSINLIKTDEWITLNKKLYIRCGDGEFLEILELQPEGKRKMTAKEYLAGNNSKTHLD